MLKEYNLLDYENSKRKREILVELTGAIGRNVSVGINFYCDSGKNIFIGDNVVVGPNCTFIDNEKITLGFRILIAPNVQIYTAYHPILPEDRNIAERLENNPVFFNTCGDPVEIKDGVWIGGGVIILPNVTIGKRYRRGSVVTRSIPDNCVAVGNPCKPVKFFLMI